MSYCACSFKKQKLVYLFNKRHICEQMTQGEKLQNRDFRQKYRTILFLFVSIKFSQVEPF